MDRVRLRPMRSPSGPKISAPSGRMPKETANTANTDSTAAGPEDSGKNTVPKVPAR